MTKQDIINLKSLDLTKEEISDKNLEELYFSFQRQHKELDEMYKKAVETLKLKFDELDMPLSQKAIEKYC